MFEGIRNTHTGDGLTGASYRSGDVIGSVSFSTDQDRTGVLSSIGPDEAVRECAFSHWFSTARRRYKASARERVEDYTQEAGVLMAKA